MTSKLLSKTHYNDFGIEIKIDSAKVKVCLHKNFKKKAIFQSLCILSVFLIFGLHGIIKGYLLKLNYGISALVFIAILLAVILPLIFNFIRFNQVGNYIIMYNRITKKFDGNYFKSVEWDDVDYFSVVSEHRGEIVPYEVQIVLKGEKKFGKPGALLVYASTLRLDRGKMYEVFDEFARQVQKSLLIAKP